MATTAETAVQQAGSALEVRAEQASTGSVVVLAATAAPAAYSSAAAETGARAGSQSVWLGLLALAVPAATAVALACCPCGVAAATVVPAARAAVDSPVQMAPFQAPLVEMALSAAMAVLVEMAALAAGSSGSAGAAASVVQAALAEMVGRVCRGRLGLRPEPTEVMAAQEAMAQTVAMLAPEATQVPADSCSCSIAPARTARAVRVAAGGTPAPREAAVRELPARALMPTVGTAATEAIRAGLVLAAPAAPRAPAAREAPAAPLAPWVLSSSA
jgi:hypothetical protein